MESYDRQVDELEQQGERLEDRAGRIDREIDEVAGDWERKKDDNQVPGAQRPADDPQLRGDDQEQTAEHGEQQGELRHEEEDEGRSG